MSKHKIKKFTNALTILEQSLSVRFRNGTFFVLFGDFSFGMSIKQGSLFVFIMEWNKQIFVETFRLTSFELTKIVLFLVILVAV